MQDQEEAGLVVLRRRGEGEGELGGGEGGEGLAAEGVEGGWEGEGGELACALYV